MTLFYHSPLFLSLASLRHSGTGTKPDFSMHSQVKPREFPHFSQLREHLTRVILQCATHPTEQRVFSFRVKKDPQGFAPFPVVIDDDDDAVLDAQLSPDYFLYHPTYS